MTENRFRFKRPYLGKSVKELFFFHFYKIQIANNKIYQNEGALFVCAFMIWSTLLKNLT